MIQINQVNDLETIKSNLLLARAEEVAINLGCSRLELDVHAFDRSIDKASLYSWYSDKGYIRISNKSERMAKSIGKNA